LLYYTVKIKGNKNAENYTKDL